MRRLTSDELSEPDVTMIVKPERVALVLNNQELFDLLSGYIPRERADGSWEYRLPAYLAREVNAVGARLEAVAQ